VTAEDVDATLPPLALTFPTEDGGTFSVEIPATKSYLADEGSYGGGEAFCWAFGDSGSNQSLIGDTLLAGMLTVFDVDGERMGFAPSTGCDASPDARRHSRRSAPIPTDAPWYSTNPHFRGPPAGLRAAG
jgi:hypothetical protein